MPEEHQVIEQYQKRGYTHVHVRRDRPHFQYHPHYHPRHVVLHIIDGDMEVDMDGKKTKLGVGDAIDIEAERFHTTCMGAQGCTYVHAEKE